MRRKANAPAVDQGGAGTGCDAGTSRRLYPEILPRVALPLICARPSCGCQWRYDEPCLARMAVERWQASDTPLITDCYDLCPAGLCDRNGLWWVADGGQLVCQCLTDGNA